MTGRKVIPTPPFAGITLTRFYGYDLSPDLKGSGHPGKLKSASDEREPKIRKKFVPSCNIWQLPGVSL